MTVALGVDVAIEAVGVPEAVKKELVGAAVG